MKQIKILVLLILILTLTGCRSYLEDIDREAPIITVDEFDTEFYLGGDIPRISATCKDNEDETCLVTTPNYPDLSIHGTHTVTFRAEDASGNVRIETVEVTAIDRAEYITITIEDVLTTVELGSVYVFPTVSCISTESETCLIDMPTTIDTTSLTTETYLIIASDDLENTRIMSVSVEVIDTTAPTITLTGNDTVTVELGDAWTDPGITSEDLQAGLIESQDIYPDLNTVGEYIITYSTEDPSGNIGTATRTVHVVDTIDPTITLNGEASVTVELGDAWTDPGAATTDLQTVTVTQDITPDLNTVGAYVVTYTAEDASGNTSTTTRVITVEDTTDPVITLNGDATVNITTVEGATYVDPGVTTSDLQEVTVTQDITPDYTVADTYVITYTAEDASGNTATVTRTVIVS